jgi:hypothetical protein
MRITISHNRTKAQIIESVDRFFDEMFQGIAGLPVRLVLEQKSWQGSILSFALTAKGFTEHTDKRDRQSLSRRYGC